MITNPLRASNHDPLQADITASLEFIRPLSDGYPEIDRWFGRKVVPGLYDGTRKLFIHRRNGQIAALAIAKRTETELKVCTVRVAKDFIGKGLGVRLFKEAMEWLGTDKPHLTVGEDALPDFEKVFAHFGYQLTSTAKGLYHPHKVEYLYNEAQSFKG